MIIKKFKLFESGTFFHQSPKNIDRPSRAWHYFGTKEFMDTFPEDFGGKITEYVLPQKILVIDRNTVEGRRLAVKLANIAYPDDVEFQERLSAGDKDAFDELYEIWCDSENVSKMFTPDVDAIKFGQEYVVPQRVVTKLQKIGIYKP